MSSNTNNEKDPSVLLEAVKDELLSYTANRLKLFKLDVFEKSAIIASQLGFITIVVALACLVSFFLLFGLAYYLGEIFGSPWLGFAFLCAFSLLVFILVIAFGKRIKSFLLNKILLFILKLETIDKNDIKKEDEEREQ